MNKNTAKQIVMGDLVAALHRLEASADFARLMPEVRVNLVYATPDAKSPREVAAVDGRITVVNGRPRAAGLPRWGASDHMARLVLEMRQYDATINAGINFRYDAPLEKVVREYGKEKGLLTGWIDRTHEPEEVATQDGASIPWKVKQLVASSGGVPRLFYEGDGWGKEPLYFAVGADPATVVGIALDIARRYREKTA
ncbi:MAG: thiamine-phosphate synthase family protein [Chloroflexota bacterium]